MKTRMLIVLIILCYSFQMNAQTRRYYCEIKGTEKELSSRMKIIFDFGQGSSYNLFTDLNHRMKFVDENGEVIEFNSKVDAMNYMSERGWKFQQAYSTYRGERAAIEHWILYKDAKDKEEAREGIMTKEEYDRLK